jgi:hypothetical protein
MMRRHLLLVAAIALVGNQYFPAGTAWIQFARGQNPAAPEPTSGGQLTLTPGDPPVDQGPLHASYQEAYRKWRVADPNLERDAGGNPASIGTRADSVLAEAEKYFAVRRAYFDALAREAQQSTAPLETPVATPALDPAEEAAVDRYIAGQLNSTARNLAALPADQDPGFQQLRRTLEREHAALTTLMNLTKDLPKEQDQLQQSIAATEKARAEVVTNGQEFGSDLRREGQEAEKTATAWAGYYRALSDGARAAAGRSYPAGSAAPISGNPAPIASGNTIANTSAAPPSAKAVEIDPAKKTAPVRSQASAGPSTIAAINNAAINNAAINKGDESPADDHARVLRSTSPEIAPVSRYAGAWVYPEVGEHYHGSRPASVDLLLTEQNGGIIGTFVAKYRLLSGGATDVNLNFSFGGTYQNAHSQKFAILTAEGAMGTLELIPTTTFNMIEVLFSTEARPGKVHQGNFFLLRK